MEKFRNTIEQNDAQKESIEKERVDGIEERLFREYFAELGYKEHPALQLIPPDNDRAVPFIGSSTNAFKENLERRAGNESPAFILQPCIRTHDIVHGYDVSNIPLGMPFFHIYGTFNARGTYAKTAHEIMGYFRNANQIPNERILIKPTVPELHGLLLAPFIEAGARTEVDYGRFYQWKYGIDGVSGKGITLFIRHPNGTWWDVGNVVSIRDDADAEIAVEFGIGAEFFKTALHGYDDPFEASIMAKIAMPNNAFHKKVLIYFETALAASGTLTASRGRTKRFAGRYVHIARYLCEMHGYTRSEVEHIARAYGKIATTQVDIDAFLEKYDARLSTFDRLESLLSNILQNPLYANLDIERIRTQLKEHLTKNGIRTEELSLHAEKYHKNNFVIQELCRTISI